MRTFLKICVQPLKGSFWIWLIWNNNFPGKWKDSEPRELFYFWTFFDHIEHGLDDHFDDYFSVQCVFLLCTKLIKLSTHTFVREPEYVCECFFINFTYNPKKSHHLYTNRLQLFFCMLTLEKLFANPWSLAATNEMAVRK